MPYPIEQQFQALCNYRDNPGQREKEDKLFSNPKKVLNKLDEKITDHVGACRDEKPKKIAKKAATVLYYELVALAYHRVDMETVCNRLQQKRGFELETISVQEIYHAIARCRNNPKSHAHLDKIFGKGSDKIREKLCEEVSEFILACKDRERADIVDEASDLLYYLLISLVYYDVDLLDLCDWLNQKRNLL